jgi:hypothetical protein
VVRTWNFGTLFEIRQDPGSTGLLRQHSLGGLSQIISVLRGDMVFVAPTRFAREPERFVDKAEEQIRHLIEGPVGDRRNAVPFPGVARD